MGPVGKYRGVVRLAWLVAAALLSASLIRAFAVAFFLVPSQSMLPGLEVGDFFMATKYDYGWSSYAFSSRPLFRGRLFGRAPRVGDVVVFSGPVDPRVTFVKRVMAVGGQTVEMRAGRVVLDGRALPQRFAGSFRFPVGPGVTCLHVPGLIDLRIPMPDGRPGCRMNLWVEYLPDGRRHFVTDFAVAHSDTMAPVRVPEGSVFMMGDDRDDSLDSRFPVSVGGLGMVPEDRLLGRVRRIVSSSDGTGSWARPWTWRAAWRPERIGPIL